MEASGRGSCRAETFTLEGTWVVSSESGPGRFGKSRQQKRLLMLRGALVQIGAK